MQEAKEATKLARILRKIEADAQPLQQMSGMQSSSLLPALGFCH